MAHLETKKSSFIFVTCYMRNIVEVGKDETSDGALTGSLS